VSGSTSYRIPQPSRAWLNEHDVSWLDLRGHLGLVTQGFFVDAEVTPQRERPVRSSAMAGRVGLEVAALLLAELGVLPGVRAIASRLERSASTVSEGRPFFLHYDIGLHASDYQI
jgi:hypothetical protein